MNALGTILPTRASLQVEERSYRDSLAKRAAAVRRMGLDSLPQKAAQMPDMTQYFLRDGTWLEVDLGGRCRRFERRADGERFVAYVDKIPE